MPADLRHGVAAIYSAYDASGRACPAVKLTTTLVSTLIEVDGEVQVKGAYVLRTLILDE